MPDDNGNGRVTNRALIERIDERTEWTMDALKDLQEWVREHTREHITIRDRLGKLAVRQAVIWGGLGLLTSAVVSAAVAKVVGWF